MTNRLNKSDRVPDLLLEQYRLDELSTDASLRIERQLDEDPDLGARLEALDRSDEEIRRRYPPEWLAGQIRLRLGSAEPAPGRPARAAWRGWAVPAAVAATVFLAMVLMSRPSGPLLAPEATRLKGPGPRLALYRRTAEGSQPVSEGDVLRRGDLVRIGYQAAGRHYGMILSIDGRGEVTRHLPVQGPAAAALDRGGLVLLDDAYELDDAPRWEAFCFVTSDEPFDVEPVLAAAREAVARGRGSPPPAIALRANLDQAIFILRKEEAP